MEYLQKDDIILINRMTIDRHGGNFVHPLNFLNEPPLDYLIEAVKSNVFGRSLYPEIIDKAGLYMFNIIRNHVFHDGNKRTGLEAALLFLRLNDFRLKDNLGRVTLNEKNIPSSGESNQEILTNFTLELAASNYTLEECQKWFDINTMRIK